MGVSYAHTITHTHLYMLIPTTKSYNTLTYTHIYSQVYPHIIMSALHAGQFAPLWAGVTALWEQYLLRAMASCAL